MDLNNGVEGEDKKQGIEVKLPGGANVKLIGLGSILSTVVLLLTLMTVVLAINTFFLWMHNDFQAKSDESKLKGETSALLELQKAILELARLQSETTKAQMLTSCILAMPQNERGQQFSSESSLCRRMTR